MYKFGTRSIERLKGVNPDMVKCLEMALAISKCDMTIPWMGGLRSSEDQKSIFEKGNSKCDGYSKKSYHQSGNAADCIPVVGGYSNDKDFRHFAGCMFHVWQKLLKSGEVNGLLEWGGHWQNFIDLPHWQIRL